MCRRGSKNRRVGLSLSWCWCGVLFPGIRAMDDGTNILLLEPMSREQIHQVVLGFVQCLRVCQTALFFLSSKR